MDQVIMQKKPGLLVPILIGGIASATISSVPFLSIVNCLCCAGIMGGVILGVWFYKKSFPPDLPFTLGDGIKIGTLGGLVGGALYSIVILAELGVFTGNFASAFGVYMDEALRQMESSNTDPASMEQIRTFLEGLIANPGMLLIVVVVGALVLFTVFGVLGGLIGGSIFKTKQVPVQ